ncbi:MAG TPA: D-TA family PLP-dependent enzyme [Planctomycetes bacterium]|nr:D-TA family PLP-dependent enzyme [Planctomycetota bacterium]
MPDAEPRPLPASWYEDPTSLLPPRELLDSLPTPLLAIHMGRVRANIARVLALTNGPERWRPHLKTTKTPEVWAELLAAGLRAFKCATVREAEVFCDLVEREGRDGIDLLLAHPLLGPGLGRLAALATRHPSVTISILVEDARAAATLPAPLTAFVDVDPGMHRTGLSPEHPAEILRVAEALGARLRGIHFYEGHLHDSDPDVRRAAVHAALDRLVELRDRFVASGLEIGELVTSGTPAFLSALSHRDLRGLDSTLHRVSPGTVVFHDVISEHENPELGLAPAALVLARVVSRPAPDRATLDTGTKSVSSDAGDPCCFVLGHEGFEPLHPSEEHLPLRVPPSSAPERGALLALVPRHVCPTVNLHDRALLVDGTQTRETSVAARGHGEKVPRSVLQVHRARR